MRAVEATARQADCLRDAVEKPRDASTATGEGNGGEAGIALQAIAALRETARGLCGVCYDGAFRGTHRNALMKRGLVVVTPHHAGATPRAHLLVKDCPCGRTHDLWTKGGAVCLRTINIEGEEVIDPLEITEVEPRASPGSQSVPPAATAVRQPPS